MALNAFLNAFPLYSRDWYLFDVPNLDELLSIGQLLPCFVTMVGEDPETTKKSITLSIDPHKVNSNLSSSLLRHGMVLSAVVTEIEDHGYVMDLGVNGVKAFLKKEECEAYMKQKSDIEHFHIGQVIQCMIDIADKANPASRITNRVVNLTVDPVKVKSAMMKASMNINLHTLIPGMLLPCSVVKIVKEGVIIKSLQYDGCVPKIYLKSPLDKPHDYKIGEKIHGRVMYIHPILKTMYVTFNKFIVEKNEINAGEMFANYGIGDIVKKAIVVSSNKYGINFKIDNTYSAFCKLANLGDEIITDMPKNFPVQSSHKSVLDQEIFVPSDINPGEVHQCEVVRLVSSGLVVRLSSRVLGFVPMLHLSDVNLKFPEKQFHRGKKIRCRVLSVEWNEAQTSIKLSHKASIVKTKHDLITNYNDIKVGQICDGVIIFVSTDRLAASFYNNITGIINARNFGIDKVDDVSTVFQKGQVVRCQVIKVDKEKKKLILSLKVREKGSLKDRETNFETGQIMDVKVIAKTNDGINVNILPKEIPGFIPINMLSDNLTLTKYLHESYEEGAVMQAVYFMKKRVNILSRKLSLMEAAKNKEMINYFSDVKIGMHVLGVISNIVNFGIFVQLSQHLSGLVPKNKMDIPDLEDSEENNKFEIDQAVIAKVTDIKPEKQQIELSVRLKDVYSGEVMSSVCFLESYLTGLDQVLKYYSTLTGIKKDLSELYIGCVVPVTITKKLKSGFTGMIKSSISCICTVDHCEGVEFEVGDEIPALVLFINIESCAVQVLVTPSVIKRIGDCFNNWHSKVNINQKIKCDLLLAHDDYALVMLRGHANGRIAFLPNKKHLNDTIGRTELWTLFQTYPIKVQRIVDDKCLVVLDAHSGNPKLTSMKKMAVEKRKKESASGETPPKRRRRDSSCSDVSMDNDEGDIKKHDLTLGEIYIAVVRSVKATQINIFVNGKVPGRIHISEASDKIIEGQNPLDQFKVGQNLKVRVIGFRKVNASGFLPISHKNFTQAIPECSAKESTIENEDYNIETFEEGLCAGQEVVGYFKRFVNSCLWFKLTPHLDGKLYILNFSDDPKVLSEVENLKPGSAYRATIVSVGSDFVQLTRTETQQVKEGMVLIGKILSTSAVAGTLVRLPHSYRGYIDLTDTGDTFQHSKIMLEEALSKIYVHCCILEVNHKTKECVVSTRHSRTKRNFRKTVTDREILDISDVTVGDIMRGFVKTVSKHSVVVKLGRSIEGYINKALLSINKNVLDVGLVVEVRISNINEGRQKIDLQLVSLFAELECSSVGNSKLDEAAINDENVKDNLKMDVLGKDIGFQWSNDLETVSDNDDSGSESEAEEVVKKRKRAAKSGAEEALLRKKELSTLRNEQKFETVDEFEKACLSCPNSSIVWINWMAFHLDVAELDKARAVAEKALKTISFREEVEKYNVWVAYLNLENMCGTTETLKDVFKRALQECDQMNIYKALINIYCSSNKLDETETLYNIMLEKFNQNKQVWIDYGLFLTENKQFEKSRNVMQRSLKNVPKRDHLDILSQFARYEMKFGDVERGKTMFDNILASYPKKTNIWSVYLDLLHTHGDVNCIRQVLDHAISIKLPIKTKKFIFKKFIALETQFGTEETLENIKQKVINFVDCETI
ncbi:Protein RRP5 [Nymphon striatum]|nr:Protein RRP5 [Nymphon striatum]